MLVRHVIESACWSVDDDTAAQSFSDWALVCRAVFFAANTRLDIDNPFANAFPGDHYRLLSGLLSALNDKSSINSIVDIGTHYGTGTRVMLDYAPEAKVTTFDVTAWDKFPTTFLQESDFVSNGGRLTQYLENLQHTDVFNKHKELLINADFIMCDGPKDGVFEESFISKLASLSFPNKPRFLLLDDIRFTTEMPLWRRIQSPKIDLTSFGHFSGTGLVNISNGLVLANT
jgi:hypothetical protein